MMRFLTVWLLGLAACLALSSAAEACRCVPPQPERISALAAASPAVFIGRVERIERLATRRTEQGEYTNRRYHFSIEKGWANDADPQWSRREIAIESEEGPCCECVGYGFQKDHRYLVFADPLPKNRPGAYALSVASRCGPTTDLADYPDHSGYPYRAELGKPHYGEDLPSDHMKE